MLKTTILICKKNLKKYKFTSFVLLLFFLLTNNYYNKDESINNGFMDINSYLKLYEIIVKNKPSNDIPFYHFERWPIHIMIGYINDIFNIKNSYYTYLFLNIIITISIIKLIEKLEIGEINKIAILSLILFNPYLLRMYICNPIAISDLLFVYSAILFVVGIEIKKITYLIIGTFIALIAKQSSIILIPIIFIYMLNKNISFKVTIICTITILTYHILNQYFISLYIIPDTNYINLIQNGWKIYNKNYQLYENFILRFFIFISTLSGFILINIKDIKNKKYIIIIFIITLLQPILFGPNVTGNNIERLSALGIAFLIPIISYEKSNNLYLFIITNIILSFHHHFSIIINIGFSKYIYGSIIVIIPLIIILLKKTNYILKYNKLP